MFTIHAEKYQPHSWFYAMTHEVIKHEIKVPNETAIFVYKDNEAFFFEGKLKFIKKFLSFVTYFCLN